MDRTTSKACVLAAMESGCSKTFVVEGEATREQFARFAPSDARFAQNGARVSIIFFGRRVASIVTVHEPEDVATARKQSGVVLVDVSANGWSIIPAENLVAASAEEGKWVYRVREDEREAWNSWKRWKLE